MLEVWQAEWCPHSAVARRRLTDLGVDYVTRQVPVAQEERTRLREATGQETIPALVFDDGSVLTGSDEEGLAGIDARRREP